MTQPRVPAPHDRLLPGEQTFAIDPQVLRALRDVLPAVATQTANAVTSEVPEYRGALHGPMREIIEPAVQMALAGFLNLAGRSRGSDPSTPLGPTIDGAYTLGRGEARGGRSMDALLAAYRVGARVSWREWARTAADAGIEATAMAQFAELLFAYIDALSAASAAGHGDELTTSGRVRERYRERLAARLVAGASVELLTAAAEQADWTPPGSLTAVLLPQTHVHGVLAALGTEALQLREDLPGADTWPADEPLSLLLVPDADASDRRHLLRILAGRQAVVGPPRPWIRASSSYRRASRTLELAGALPAQSPLDSEDHLADLVITADAEALTDLRTRVLAPLASVPAATRDRLTETLHGWLVHLGRRDQVAAELHIHAQTVRYRMGQLRDAYGDQLDDPHFVRDAVIALAPTLEPPVKSAADSAVDSAADSA